MVHGVDVVVHLTQLVGVDDSLGHVKVLRDLLDLLVILVGHVHVLDVGPRLRTLLPPLDELPDLREALLEVEGDIHLQVLLRDLALEVEVGDLIDVVVHDAVLDKVLADLLAVRNVLGHVHEEPLLTRAALPAGGGAELEVARFGPWLEGEECRPLR